MNMGASREHMSLQLEPRFGLLLSRKIRTLRFETERSAKRAAKPVGARRAR